MWDMETKVANSGATDAGKHKASEYNNRQAELEKAVTHAGITLTSKPADPDATPDSNTEMLAEAMSRVASKAVYGTDGGSANTYVVSAVSGLVAPKALFDGMRVHFVPGNANTGASTLNAFGLGVKKLRTFDDTDLNGGELSADAPCEAIYDSTADSATGAWLLLPWTDLWIKSDMTITVGASGADYTTIQAALDSLKYKLIARDATVTISLAAETFSISGPIEVNHPMAHRIEIIGATPGTIPNYGDFVGTKATDKTMLEGRFDTIFDCSGAGIRVHGGSTLKLLKNCLFLGPGSATGLEVGHTEVDGNAPSLGVYRGPGGATLENCWFHDFNDCVYSREGSFCETVNSGASYGAAMGFRANNNSYITGHQLRCVYCDINIYVQESSTVEIFGCSIGQGTTRNAHVANGSFLKITEYGGWNVFRTSPQGVYVDSGSVAKFVSLNFTGTTNSSTAWDGSHVIHSSCTNLGTHSPTSGSDGNRNSFIAVV